MAEGLLGGMAAPLPPMPHGSSISPSANLVEVNHAQELQALQFSRSEFVDPYIKVTVSAVFGQGFEVSLWRDAKPEVDDADGMLNTESLRIRGKKPTATGDGKGGKAPAAGAPKHAPAAAAPPLAARKRAAGEGDESGGDADWEEDPQAPWVGQKSTVGLDERQAKEVQPMRRPPAPKYPEHDHRGKEKIPLSEDMRNYIARFWVESGAALFRMLLVTGVNAVRITDDPVAKKKIFSVVAPHLRTLAFQENTANQVQRRWFARYLDRQASSIVVTADGKVVRPEEYVRADIVATVDTKGRVVLLQDAAVTVQDNENNRSMPTMDGGATNLIFVLDQPDSAGNLTSPVWQSAALVTSMASTRYTELYANFHRAQPLMVIAPAVRSAGSGSGTSGRELLTPSAYAQGDVLQQRQAYAYQQTEDERQRYEMAAEAARNGGGTMGAAQIRARMQVRRILNNTVESQYMPPDINSIANMYAGINLVSPVSTNSIVLPAGQTMMGGPVSEGSGNFSAWIEWMRAQMGMIWEVPPQILDPSGTKYATDGATLNRRWETKVRDYSKKLAEMIATIWSAAHADKANAFANAIRKALKEDQKAQEEAAAMAASSPSAQVSGAEAQKPAPKRRKLGGRQAAAEGQANKEGSATKAEEDEDSSEVEVDVASEKARLEKLSTKEARTLNSLLSETKARRKLDDTARIKKSLRVEVAFNVSLSSGDPGLVQTLLSMDGIDTNTAIAVLGEQAGIPRNLLLLSEESRAEQRRQRLQSDTDAMHANTMPPIPLRPDGKPAAKPAPQPSKPPAKPAFETQK